MSCNEDRLCCDYVNESLGSFSQAVQTAKSDLFGGLPTAPVGAIGKQDLIAYANKASNALGELLHVAVSSVDDKECSKECCNTSATTLGDIAVAQLKTAFDYIALTYGDDAVITVLGVFGPEGSSDDGSLYGYLNDLLRDTKEQMKRVVGDCWEDDNEDCDEPDNLPQKHLHKKVHCGRC